MLHTFKNGDSVIAKSNDKVKMTINERSADSDLSKYEIFTCIWFEGSTLYEKKFHFSELKIVEEII